MAKPDNRGGKRGPRPIRIYRWYRFNTTYKGTDEQAILDEEERQEKADKAAETAERTAEHDDFNHSMQEMFDNLARLRPDQIRRVWRDAKHATAAKSDGEFQRFLAGVIGPHAQK